MEQVLEWMKTLIFFSLFVTLIIQLLPGSQYKKYVRFFAGMILIVLAVSPLFRLFCGTDAQNELLEAFAYKQESSRLQMDFPYMEQKQQEYYQEQVQVSARELIEKQANAQGFWMEDVKFLMDPETGMVSEVTVYVRELAEDRSFEQAKQEQNTAVEEIYIRISKPEKQTQEVPKVRSEQLQTELSKLFGISGNQVHILEGSA